ncbi:V-type ATPase 116kDa subunit family protein [Saccharopolyspora oryzae]|uniref:ATPase n=1 Tax=Saccharopolyspora oryzae TaxID=2997343 RepID=A0ABT4UTT9_9PSEU|nr:V-type ATPase 116kDa subunit family protein [Saccharopolyspora oryzae]MDA3625136.1 ATPase [Saccharopolyspora oryzae]
MSWREAVLPVRMQRVAVLAPADSLREVLVRVAGAGVVQFEPGGEAEQRLHRAGGGEVAPKLAAQRPDLDLLERTGRADLLAGEAELEGHSAIAVRRGSVAGLAGWCARPDLPGLAEDLAAIGGAVVPLPAPRGVDPPTSLRAGGAVRRSFSGVVRTYGTVAYPDVDPTLPAGVAYVLMFGMMFGDLGHGLLLVLAGVLLAFGRPSRLAKWRHVWPFVTGAGATGAVFGLLYGEFFGPTGVVPVLWLAPLAEPIRLLTSAVAVGAVLLAAAYAVAIVNRWREGGPQLAVYASSGIAGAALLLGIGCVAGGLYLSSGVLAAVGGGVAVVGVLLAGAGYYATTSGGAAGALQSGVQAFDAVVRVGSNLVSFARLAAFGLTHAALGWLVWQGTTALFGAGPLGVLAAIGLFAAGNALAFALEALVAGIQALRLEFYELFSRVFAVEGRPFQPWHVPVVEFPEEEP